MLKNKKVVRNYAVFCAESLLRNRRAEIRGESVSKIKKVNFKREYVLSKIFKEEIDYSTLMYYYSEAINGKENQYFSIARFYDKKHAVRIDNDNNIILYYYQDLPRIRVPWNYPHLITCIGTTDINSTLCYVFKDLKNMSALNFLMKYYLKKTDFKCKIVPIEKGYLIDDFLKITVDMHVTFHWLDINSNWQEQYISDTWWSTKEEIIYDLTNMNLLKYGKKYYGFWGR